MLYVREAWQMADVAHPLTVPVAVCDTQIENGGAPTPLTDCNMACAGNGTELCGGPNRLNVSVVDMRS